jgi:AcrR family transcriptional regulator
MKEKMQMARVKITIDLIRQEAVSIVSEEGIHSLSLGELARRLGIKTPSLYNHIDGLNGLKKQIAIYGLEKLYEALASFKEMPADTELALELAYAYIAFVRNQPGLYEAMFLDKALQDDAFHHAANRVVDVVVYALTAFQIAPDQRIHIVRGLRSLIHGFVSIEQRGGFGIPILPDQSLDVMIRTYLRGIDRKSL